MPASERVPVQRLGRWGLYTLVCVLVTPPVWYCQSVLLARAPGVLLHSSLALSFTATPHHLSSPVPLPMCCAPALLAQASGTSLV